VVETPSYDLTWFKLTFGRLGLKAYTKGERVLRVEATCHNAAELGCGRVLERLPEIVARLGGMAERFCTTLDCASVGFVPDGFLDELARPCTLGHLTGQSHGSYTVRQAAYDLRKFRAKGLVEKPGRSRRYHVPAHALRSICALTTIRDRVLAPLVGEVRRPPRATDRKNWTPVEHDYEKLRSDLDGPLAGRTRGV
jgi:hypothetical protein